MIAIQHFQFTFVLFPWLISNFKITISQSGTQRGPTVTERVLVKWPQFEIEKAESEAGRGPHVVAVVE